MELKRIASFQVDHTSLKPGLYLSRADGDVLTWDLRLTKPNEEPPLAVGALHSLEHLGATYLRSSASSGSIIYFGPMGCRTGLYLLTRELGGAPLIALVQACFAFIAAYDGPMPGASASECGNWTDHDPAGARAAAARYRAALEGYGEAMLDYGYPR